MSKFDPNDPLHQSLQESYVYLESLKPISYDKVVELLTDTNAEYQIEYNVQMQQYFDGKCWKQKSYSLVSIRKTNDYNDLGEEFLAEDEDVNDIYAKLVAALKEKTNPYFWIHGEVGTPAKLVCDIGESHLAFPKEILKDLLENASDTERPGDIACCRENKWIYLPSTLKSKQKKIENKQQKQE